MLHSPIFPTALNLIMLRTKILSITIDNMLINNDYKTLSDLEKRLSLITKQLLGYDFIQRIKMGSCLLVGEGNLSFTLSLLNKTSDYSDIIASTYEKHAELSDLGKTNYRILQSLGVSVMDSLDATNLSNYFSPKRFNTIIFQFPHSGNREFIDDLHPNYLLVYNFIKSALDILRDQGVILITTVNNNFYNHMFNFEGIAKSLSIKLLQYHFDPMQFPGYTHTMTNGDGSAIDNYNKFTTWEFSL